MAEPRKLACPRCGTLTPFTAANEWRPFCSERCKMIDLGLWASERYRVPAEEEQENPDDHPDDPNPKPHGS